MKTARHKQKTTGREIPTSVAKLARRSCEECLRKVHNQLSAVPSNDVVEWTHQLRVATRRADVSLRLFKHWLPAADRERLQRTLGRIRDNAGVVRDLDLLMDLWPVTAKTLDAPKELTAWLLERWDVQRRLEFSKLRKWTRQSRRSVFQDRLESLIARVKWQGDGKPPAAYDWCPHALSKLVRKFENSLEESGDHFAHCHRTRIAVRRLRYAMEILARSQSVPQSQPLCEELSNLQDELGRINDASAALEYLCQAEGDCNDASLTTDLKQYYEVRHSAAIGLLAAWKSRIPSDLKSFVTVLHDFTSNPRDAGGG